MSLRFRQVHLDFHTSGEISGVGSAFDKKEFQRTLTEAAVDSITCFSVCHHGYSYYPTQIGQMHPSLKFDLLRAQIDAAHEVGIHVPVYISAGGNDVAAYRHPEWRENAHPSCWQWGARSELEPGFRKLCFNTGYLDYLCLLIDETVQRYPDGDGIFLDIILQRQCCCSKCVSDMLTLGMDPQLEADRIAFSNQVIRNYFERTTAAARRYNPQMRVFHNSGHLSPTHPELLKYFSHLELESLPTGGWGYDHFPQTAAYARTTDLEFLGMTGKFHSSWGEFGGLKHPNALRYECAAMLAFGAKCSIGDQLHPCGKLDKSTYEIIGQAYREVKEKEAFCRDAVNLADIALISAEAGGASSTDCDTGAGRILLECHFLFNVLHPSADFSAYKMVILPDALPVTPELTERLAVYVRHGGKVLACGDTLKNLTLDFGATLGESSGYSPTYLLPAPDFAPEFVSTPFVVYGSNLELTPTTGRSLGEVYYPYFNRAVGHFCSHRQTPNRPDPSGFACGVINGNVAAVAYPIFALYRKDGAVVMRQFLAKVIAALLGSDITIISNLPSSARVTVTEDCSRRRKIVHLLYGPTVKRGDNMEIIEDLPALEHVQVELKVSGMVKSVRLEPQGSPLPVTLAGDRLRIAVDRFSCHQMIAVEST